MKGIEARVLVPTLCAANPVIAVDLNDLPARPFSQPIKTMLSSFRPTLLFASPVYQTRTAPTGVWLPNDEVVPARFLNGLTAR